MQKIIKKRPLLTQEKLSDHPLLNRLYQSRGVQSPQELERTLKFLHRPKQLAGIEQAVEILVDGAKAHLIKARADFADLWRLERLLPQD